MKSSSQPAADSPARRANGPRPRRWLPWLGAALVVALIVIGFLPRATPVETAPVAKGRLRASVSEEGKTRIKQRYTVSAPVAGRLRRIEFKAGAPVRAGHTVVAVIEPAPPEVLDARTRALTEARREAAVANLAKAREAHRFALSELQRFRKLREDDAISVQELEPVEWRETATAKDLAAAESALRQVEAELAEFPVTDGSSHREASSPIEIKAPANGQVLRVFEESSRIVSPGTPLVELGDPSDLEVVIEVLSRDGAGIPPDTKVELEHWGGEGTLLAKVRLVEPAAFTKVSALGVEEQRVNVIADLITPFERRRGLGDNFRVEARIITWEAGDVLKVPAGALFRRGQQWAAFVVVNGRAELRPVEVGRSSGSEMQILSGLREGEEVILYPGDRVREELRVKPIEISL
jgi:HlyD family secretion protein